MKVKELIEILSKEDPGHDVVWYSGLDYNYLDLAKENIRVVNLVKNYYRHLGHEAFELQPGDLGNAIVIG